MLKKELIKEFIKLKKHFDMIERELGLVTDAKGTVKMIKYSPELYKESLNNKSLERHFFIPDLHVPDHNPDALKTVLNFIPDFKPDVVHILGDVVNFTKASDFLQIGNYKISLADEIDTASNIIQEIRKLSGSAKMYWYEGNHEFRLQKVLAKGGNILTDLKDRFGEQLVSVPSLFNLKDLDIEWVPYFSSHKVDNTEIEHGDSVRSKAGYTAHGMLDKRGSSGFSGHTHRLALVTKSQGDQMRFWVECGSLCNLTPTPTYTRKPDWVNGFAIGFFDKKQDIMHPVPILLQKGQFWFNEKIYGK